MDRRRREADGWRRDETKGKNGEEEKERREEKGKGRETWRDGWIVGVGRDV